jgi:2'-5' RNA ligase
VSDSAVLVHVPEAEPVVGEWRLSHTYDAPLGVPPHVTLLFPFVPPDRLTVEIEEQLAQLVAEFEPFDVTFARTARFPGVLYLEPGPAQPFSELTDAIAETWPEHPPYEGEHEIVIPHLTVAESEDERLIERIAADVEPQLPIELRVREAQLYVEGAGGRWHERRRFPFAE